MEMISQLYFLSSSPLLFPPYLSASYKAFEEKLPHNTDKNPTCLFCRHWQIDPKIDMEMEGTQMSKTILKEKNKHTSQSQNLLQS